MKKLKKSVGFLVNCALVCAGVGIVIAELAPGLLSGGAGASLSEPFGSYRNDLAIHWGLGGALLGAVAGFVWTKIRK